MATFVDTNVLLYAISTVEQEAEKRAIARRVLLRTDLAFSVQVLQEFYVQATRSSAGRVAPEIAVRLIRSWNRFPVQPITVELMFAAFTTHQRFGISYWDAAIIEAARSLGCSQLLTEDLQDHQDFGGINAIGLNRKAVSAGRAFERSRQVSSDFNRINRN